VRALKFPISLLLFSIIFSSGVTHAQVLAPISPSWPYVAKRLSQAGFKKSFIKALRAQYDTKDFTQVLELNVLLYLRKSDYHGPQVNHDAAKSVAAFLAQYQPAFKSEERTYGVPPAVIAGLLWLESRYGENTGRFHVPSVFIHLLQAERAPVLSHLKLAAKTMSKEKVTAKVRAEIEKRAHKKAEWALSELKALAEMQKKYGSSILVLNGSFSGAFGMPQFLPSSYLAYARSAKKKGVPDLNEAPDAIHSVANYLKQSGLRRGQRKTVEAALFKYNNSHDYGKAILNLASQTSQTNMRSKPRPAAKPRQ
jgi:membrane-bound lytic murein transglycosylase B